MVASSELEFHEGSPTVVLRDISVRYRVHSTESSAQEETQKAGNRFKRALQRTSLVEVAALNRMSLVVNHGESVGVVGRNGSGKSTLMRIIAGQEPPTTGTVFASGTPVLLGVNAALVPDLSGDQNIVLGCLAMGMSNRQVREKYDQIVELSGLGKQIHLPMKSFSSGMGSRLRFAIAAAVDPEILLIDEALNTGDEQFKGRTKKRMDALRANAGSVFLVSHSNGTIRQMCDRVIWLDEGDLLMDGSPGVVLKRYQAFMKALASDDRHAPAQMRRRLVKEYGSVEIEERSVGRRKATS
ncbi:ABC transporter ATP-binding protein [Arthrobacter monumenti]